MAVGLNEIIVSTRSVATLLEREQTLQIVLNEPECVELGGGAYLIQDFKNTSGKIIEKVQTKTPRYGAFLFAVFTNRCPVRASY